MKSHHLSLLVAAALLCAPHADAGRRDASVPIIVTSPVGSITVHMETPVPAPSPTFRTLGTSERSKNPSFPSKQISQRNPKP